MINVCWIVFLSAKTPKQLIVDLLFSSAHLIRCNLSCQLYGVSQVFSYIVQAVMASDFSIAQFRFLERLLVVHGHWCYKRIAQMVRSKNHPLSLRSLSNHKANAES